MRELWQEAATVKAYRLGIARRTGNRVIKALVASGLVSGHYALLTVRGRNTGRLHTTPVRLIEQDGERWLVSPYGAVSWVRNARAAGEVTLRRGNRTEEAAVTEVDARAAAPVLQRYLAAIRIVRPYFDVTPDSPVEDFVAEAPRHPVFSLAVH